MEIDMQTGVGKAYWNFGRNTVEGDWIYQGRAKFKLVKWMWQINQIEAGRGRWNNWISKSLDRCLDVRDVREICFGLRIVCWCYCVGNDISMLGWEGAVGDTHDCIMLRWRTSKNRWLIPGN